MRTWKISLAAVVTLSVVAVAAGQSPNPPVAPPKPAAAPAKPDPNSLEAVVAAALKNNPDIAHAEAKVNEAAASLNKARLQVMQSVVTAHGALESARMTLKITEAILEQTSALARASRGTTRAEVQNAEYQVQKTKAEVATLQAQLAILQGKAPGPGNEYALWLGALNAVRSRDFLNLTYDPDGRRLNLQDFSGAARNWDAVGGRSLGIPTNSPKIVAGSMDAKIREALTKTIRIESWKEPLLVHATIEHLKKKAGTDIPFRLIAENPQTRHVANTVDLMTGELPLSAWLAVIEDSVPDLVFVVREYGILVTTKDRMPSEGLRIREFLMRTEPKKEEPKKQ